MESKSKNLRSGYTTGACAAAAAKAAALLVRSAECGVRSKAIRTVEIPFPDGSRVAFTIHDSGYRVQEKTAFASVIKDAGDDPDITNGAEIVATVRSAPDKDIRGQAACEVRSLENSGVIIDGFVKSRHSRLSGIFPRSNVLIKKDSGQAGMTSKAQNPTFYEIIIIRGGAGVGTVTKPGLAMSVGEAAINPVPRRMIHEAVREALAEFDATNPQSAKNKPPLPFSLSLQGRGAGVREIIMRNPQLEITISVPAGEELAKKTLNHRLGIVGGISILGTTGIVKPLSEAAWTATITASFDVAKALGLTEVVLSTGRTSEKAHQRKYALPVEAYAMMGDYTEFSLRDAAKHGFSKAHVCAQWAKMVKIAMGTPQTHVRHGALEAEAARDFLIGLGVALPGGTSYNTSREILEFIRAELPDPRSAMNAVCDAARSYCEQVTGGIPVAVHLVSYEGDIIAERA